MQEIFMKFLKFLKTADIDLLTAIPTLGGIGLLIIWAAFSKRVFGGHIDQNWNWLIMILSSFIIGLSGLIQIYRRETYGPAWFFKKGLWPIISGTLTVVFFWGAAIGLIYFGIFKK